MVILESKIVLFCSIDCYLKGPCDITQFDCLDSTCINRTLACNGRQNCNHSVDEIGCLDGLLEDQDKKSTALIFFLYITNRAFLLLLANK
jgi:hypothetical protein